MRRRRRTQSAPSALVTAACLLAIAIAPARAQDAGLVPSGTVISGVNPNAPAHHYRETQWGVNDCVLAPPAPAAPNSDTSKCQTGWMAGAEKFCLFLPDAALTGNGQATIAGPDANAVAYCTMEGVGARDMPQGAINSVHFLLTNSYYQVTGKLNIAKFPGINPKDTGGQYDPVTGGLGVPVGAVFLGQFANGFPEDRPYWVQILQPSPDNDGTWLYCLRTCLGVDATAQSLCPVTFATKGCKFVIPGEYSPGVFAYETAAAQSPYASGATAAATVSVQSTLATVSGVGGPGSAYSSIMTLGNSAAGNGTAGGTMGGASGLGGATGGIFAPVNPTDAGLTDAGATDDGLGLPAASASGTGGLGTNPSSSAASRPFEAAFIALLLPPLFLALSVGTLCFLP